MLLLVYLYIALANTTMTDRYFRSWVHQIMNVSTLLTELTEHYVEVIDWFDDVPYDEFSKDNLLSKCYIYIYMTYPKRHRCIIFTRCHMRILWKMICRLIMFYIDAILFTNIQFQRQSLNVSDLLLFKLKY